MPVTKPGLKLNKEGICQACVNYRKRQETDYHLRWAQLKELCLRYKRDDGYYDCIVAISGGKDSHFQVYVMKKLLRMNPLLIAVGDPFTKTKAGRHNIYNITEAFNCDLITLKQSPELVRKITRLAFETFGSPTWAVDKAIYSYPIRMGIDLKIPLIVYGENVSWEYGGVLEEEKYSALDQIKNDVAKDIDFNIFTKNGIRKEELNSVKYPNIEEIEKHQLNPIYLSYFIPWDGDKNYLIAKKYGFRDLTHEWIREGYIENYDQIDSIAYLINVWMKYPKFGFARATDVVGYWIRSGRITKEKGKEFILKHDHVLDQRILDDFLQFTGYSTREFWDLVETFWNLDLFEKIDYEWRLKGPRFS